jgi:hypothetical protein
VDAEGGLSKSKGGAGGAARSGAGSKRDHAQISALGRGLQGIVEAAGDPAAKKNRRIPPKDIKPCNENKVRGRDLRGATLISVAIRENKSTCSCGGEASGILMFAYWFRLYIAV